MSVHQLSTAKGLKIQEKYNVDVVAGHCTMYQLPILISSDSSDRILLHKAKISVYLEYGLLGVTACSLAMLLRCQLWVRRLFYLSPLDEAVGSQSLVLPLVEFFWKVPPSEVLPSLALGSSSSAMLCLCWFPLTALLL